MSVVNNNSICAECEKLFGECKKNKFMRGECEDFVKSKLLSEKFFCQNCGSPTVSSGRCRTCSVCGESTGCS